MSIEQMSKVTEKSPHPKKNFVHFLEKKSKPFFNDHQLLIHGSIVIFLNMSLDKNSGLLPKSPLGAFFEKKGKKHFLAKSNNKGKKAVRWDVYE